MYNIIEEQYNWKPGAKFVLQTPDTIVVHHAVCRSCSAQDVHKWHLDRGWLGIGYHFFIRKNGLIYRGRPEQFVGGHLLSEENNNTLGICLEGCYTDYINERGQVLTEKEVPQTQLDALVWLCLYCKSKWPVRTINGHLDYDSAKKAEKDCPGKYFPWDKFWQMLKREENKKLIQTFVGFHNPQGVWDAIEKHHPYPDAWYQQWADSYKKTCS
ncbi:MAG: N-acetylmuramoyl-L-alanine amidase [Clostridiaceae bacterium]|nr:N-acetylmuramoyl-L-alanine amidase [Clostridiaceae bacterium]